MKRTIFGIVWGALVFLLAGGVQNTKASAIYDTTMPGHNIKHVVLYSYAVSGGHPQSRAYARQMVAYFARHYGFQLDTVGGSGPYAFTTANLQGVSLLMATNGDGNVFTTDASQSAVIDYVENKGGALFLIHASAAFIPCPVNGQENIDDPSCKFLGRATIREYNQHNNAGTPALIYADSVLPGPVPGTGITSPYSCPGQSQQIPLITTDHPHGIKNPESMNIWLSKDESGRTLPRSFTAKDEWYTYRTNYENVRATAPRIYGTSPSQGNALNGVIGASEGSVNVLFTLDENHVGSAATNGGTGTSIPACPVLGNHPEAWSRKMGKGITAYNMMGHDENEVGSNDVIFTQDDSIYYQIDWRIMRYLAGDFAGCMDSNYVEYNPEATVRLLTGHDSDLAAASKNPSIYPCQTPKTVSIEPVGSDQSITEVNSTSRGIEIIMNVYGTYHILVTDLKGSKVYSNTVMGGFNRKIQVSALPIGTYFVRVNIPKSKYSITKRISLY